MSPSKSFPIRNLCYSKWATCNHPESKIESVFILTREHFQFSHSIVTNVTIDTSHSWQLWWIVIRPTKCLWHRLLEQLKSLIISIVQVEIFKEWVCAHFITKWLNIVDLEICNQPKLKRLVTYHFSYILTR